VSCSSAGVLLVFQNAGLGCACSAVAVLECVFAGLSALNGGCDGMEFHAVRCVCFLVLLCGLLQGSWIAKGKALFLCFGLVSCELEPSLYIPVDGTRCTWLDRCRSIASHYQRHYILIINSGTNITAYSVAISSSGLRSLRWRAFYWPATFN
jgi:hypothetical protein